MDQTVAIILLAVASIGIGVWDLWGKARDVLRAVSLATLALVGGVALDVLLPGGFVAGAIAAWAVGARGVARIHAARGEELEIALDAAEDPASRLLVLHDRVDLRSLDGTVAEKAAGVAALGVLALVAVGLIAAGMTYSAWQLLLAGIGVGFLPVSQATKALTAAEERRAVQARLAPTGGAPELPGVGEE